MNAEPLSKRKRLSKDRISNLPANIIEKILCLVPIQQAGRTSILSKEWRYHWTKIPKLRFDDDTFDVLTGKDQLSVLDKPSVLERTYPMRRAIARNRMMERGNRNQMMERCKFFYAIFQVLLLHQGPIFEFTFSMKFDYNCIEIDQIILHLSRSTTVKKLKLHFQTWRNDSYKLPSSIFLLHQLTDLHLHGCDIEHEATFNGFASLTSLYIDNIKVSTKTLMQFLSRCPLLKRVTLFMNGANNHSVGDYNSTIIKLFECLPMIEYLTTRTRIFTYSVVGAAPQKLPTPLIHLKYICLKEMRFTDGYGLPFLALLIRSSPNLEKIKLEISVEGGYIKTKSVTLEDYSDFWLEHLTELEIVDFTNLKTGLEFVKLILAKSPMLKKVSILFDYRVLKDQESEALRILSISPRASQRAEINIVNWRY